MDYLRSCQTSIQEITTFVGIHVRVYRRPPNANEPRVEVDRLLTETQWRLNEGGVYTAVDVNQSKVLVFAHDRTELEHLLKPFTKLVGTKITLACRDDLVFDFIDQKDVTLREVLSVPHSDKHRPAPQPNAQEAAASPAWQRFRSTVAGAMQDFVVHSATKVCRAVPLDRQRLLLLDDGAVKSAMRGLTNIPHLLTIHVDFLVSGKVLAYTSIMPLTNHRWLETTQVSHGHSSLHGERVLIVPTLLKGRITAGCQPANEIKRAHTLAWLERKGIQVDSALDTTDWVDVELDAGSSQIGESQNTIEPTHRLILPWPRTLVLASHFKNRDTGSERFKSFLAEERSIFEAALDWKASKISKDSAAAVNNDEDAQLPPIPPDMCHNLPGLSGAPSPDTNMKDAHLEAQQAGIYPTPSDGITSHQTPGSFSHDSPYLHSSQHQEPQAVTGADDQPDRMNGEQGSRSGSGTTQQQGSRGRSRSPGTQDVTRGGFRFFEGSATSERPMDNDSRGIKQSPVPLSDSMEIPESDDGLFSEDNSGGAPDGNASDTGDRMNVDSLDTHQETQRLEGFNPGSLEVPQPTNLSSSPRHALDMTKLNAKYAENGTFRPGQLKSVVDTSKINLTEQSRIPKIGFPAESASEPDDDSSDATVETDEPRQSSPDEIDRTSSGSSSCENGSLETHTSQQDAARWLEDVDQILASVGNTQNMVSVSDVTHKSPAFHWSGLQHKSDHIFIDDAAISMIQNLTESIVAHSSQNRKGSRKDPQHIHDPYGFAPGTRQADLLTLALPSQAAQPALFTDTSVLSPDSKRHDQETRIHLRHSLSQIETLHLRIQRHAVDYSVLPTAVYFSESLGLGPANGPKDVLALCISPLQRSCGDGIEVFHRVMRDTYISRQYGSYDSLDLQESATGTRNYRTRDSIRQYTSGHYAVKDVDSSSTPEEVSTEYAKACRELARELDVVAANGRSVVIFMVDVFEDERSLLHLATSSQHLIQSCRALCDDCAAHPGGFAESHDSIVFIVIPGSYVNKDLTVSVPALSPTARSTLAARIYDTIEKEVATTGPFANMTDARPSLTLDTPNPSSIPFELNATPPKHLFLQDTFLHIAYTFNSQRNWLVATWTENTGRYQNHRTYPLKHLSFSIIFEEIWQSTLAVLNNDVGKTIRWQVFVTKVGSFQVDELKTWVNTIGEQPRNVSIYLLSTETQPKFSINMNNMLDDSSSNTPHPNVAANFSSPNASTPAAPTPDNAPTDADTQARLIDLTDQTWSLILSFQPNTADNPSLYLPSLLSALLIKRVSERDSDPPAFMQVNLMRVLLGSQQRDRGAPDYAEVMKKLLKAWAGLGVLARARGMKRRESVRPGFVAFVEEAVGGLERLVGL